MAAGGVDRTLGADQNVGADGDHGAHGADRAVLCQAPGSDRSPAGDGVRDGAIGGEIRGGGAVLDSTGSFTA